MEEKIKKYIYSTSLLAGTIIGVGLFSLPYITAQVGLPITILYFLIIIGLVLVIHLLFSEVALKTPDFLRFSGYAKIYLGKIGSSLTSISVIGSLIGSLLAYLIVGGKFLGEIFIPIVGGNDFIFVILYFILGSIFIFFGVRAISKIEFWGLVLFILILCLLAFPSISHFKRVNLSVAFNSSDLFLPYGPILYSLWGAALIPQAEEILGREKKQLKKITVISIIIPAVIYLFFIIMILGIAGKGISPAALTCLGGILGNNIYKVGLLLGVLTTFTSFVALGLTLKDVFHYDFKISKNISWFFTCFVPLALFLLGFQNFIEIIGFIGAVFLGITGILIIFMYQKIKKETLKVKILTLPLILVFALGIIYQIIYFLK